MTLPPALVDRLRARLGYGFPPLGRRAFNRFFRCLPDTMETELFPGLRVTLDFRDETQRATYWKGPRFDRPTGQYLEKWGQTADAFFDIGANYGFFSCWMLSRLPRLQVYAFDPLPANNAHMSRTRDLNGLAARFHVAGHALGDREETRLLRLGGADSGHSTFGAHTGLSGATLEAPLVPFDRWRERTGLALPDRPRWTAKIDVEGFELKVLAGMEQSLRSRAFRGLAVEVNPYTLSLFDTRPADLSAFLARFGYRPTGPALSAREREAGYNAFFVPGEPA